ncbi:DUF2884 family protein [Oleiagrimonas soli]|uniref:DUF2884 family protein n=1 Tax=Oleiagrimonas soli TaxID=1543381 RepID=A0A099CWQ1_9GAMM|nr:DUF2884 family protein [Oleiagrimonas soli]KGI78086.1 hypothetical protein LF63_0106890 [Oleiagrimonas soli]MBB6183496.1 hypothetical protein [Oleiagrimonas soli]
MRGFLAFIMLALLCCADAQAQDLFDVCHASSSYDVTIEPQAVVFDRAQVAPKRVRMQGGALQVDGANVALDAADHGRIQRFEQIVRSLEPKVKAIADRAVDLAAATVREQGDSAALDARIDMHVRELKARIARSHSTHDWQGPAFQNYVNQTVGDLLPLLANDLLGQAMTAAMNGDLGAAATLRDRAAGLTTSLQARIQQRLQVLRPQVQALCPSVRQLDALESGLGTALPGDARLDLVEVAR